MSAAENRAVFLSYASQDAEAARHICEALRGAGVEVWFDADGGLEHGDEWDAKIRRQIKECVLFIAVISANTQAREEGYFRLEWDLAAERARTIAGGVAFILPVLIDDTREPEALVPDRFRTVQWTKLPGGAVTPEVLARYLKLWSHRTGASRQAPNMAQGGTETAACERPGPLSRKAPRWGLLVAGALAALAAAGVAVWRPWQPAAPAFTAASSPEVAELVRRAWKLVDNPGRGRVELEAADELCKRAAALEPTNAGVLAVWAQIDSWMVLLRVDDSPVRREAGRTKAKRAVQLAPESFEARLALPCFEVREAGAAGPENAPEIEATLRGLLRERPGEPHALIALGMLQRFTGRSADARKTFEELTRNPEFSAAGWGEMAFMHFHAREYAEAERTIEASVRLQPFFWNLALQTWLSLYWRGDLEAAAATLPRLPRDSLREEEGVDTALQVHLLRRDGAALLRLMETTPREWIGGPNAGPRAGFLAMAYQFLGREQAAAIERTAALRLVERRLGETPSAVELLTWKCRLLAEQGDLVGAAEVARALRQVRPARDRLEEVTDLVLIKDLEGAIDLLEQLAKEPSDAWFTAAYVRHYWRFDPLRAIPRFQAFQARLDADPRFSPGRATPPGAATARDASAAKSVAVLPFENLSDDKANEYFSDGISEELLDAIGKVPGLRVAGRTSSFSFKGKNVPEAEIARQLGVTHIVSGSVQKVGPEIHIRARLVNGSDGLQLWSDKFTRDAKDVIALQDEIAGLIARTLKLKLGAARVARPVDPEAHSLVLEGRHFWNLRGADPENLSRAERALLAALKIDPAFPQALAGLADVYVIRAWWAQMEGRASEAAQDIARARQRATAVLSLDDSLPEPHAALGTIHFLEGAFAEAERAFARAYQNNPSHAVARHWHSVMEAMQGRLDLALEHSRDSALADPRSPNTLWSLAAIYNYARRHEEALTAVDRSLALRPGFLPALAEKAVASWFLGREADAVAAARAIASDRTSTIRWHADAVAIFVLRLAELQTEAEEVAGRVRATVAPDDYRWGFALAALGKMEDAYAATVQVPTTAWGGVFYHRLWDQGRDDARFLQMVERLGCAAHYKAALASLEKLAGTAKK